MISNYTSAQNLPDLSSMSIFPMISKNQRKRTSSLTYRALFKTLPSPPPPPLQGWMLCLCRTTLELPELSGEYLELCKDMKQRCQQLAKESHIQSDEIWRQVRDKIAFLHGNCFTSLTREQVKGMVKNVCNELNHGVKFNEVESIDLHLMKDGSNTYFFIIMQCIPILQIK
jgi:hypothetical protein